ncbi:MAG: YfiR family protein, partial [Acidobacteriota bacterium]
FTVSDLADFAAMGGTAHLFPENGRLRFAVNVESAQRAGLHLRSQLLALARIVKDEPYAMGR